MKTNLELDGENISIEQSSPSDIRRTLDQDDFYPADGNYANEDGIVTMVAASAAQNTPNYYDQDNFYPADGIRNIKKTVKNYLSPAEREKRIKLRQERKSAKTSEIQSRAELNKSLGQDKQSDVELAKALKGDDTSTSKTSQPMSKNTKIAIGVGVVVVLGAVAFFVLRKKK
jgi:hypothetical protein